MFVLPPPPDPTSRRVMLKVILRFASFVSAGAKDTLRFFVAPHIAATVRFGHVKFHSRRSEMVKHGLIFIRIELKHT